MHLKTHFDYTTTGLKRQAPPRVGITGPRSGFGPWGRETGPEEQQGDVQGRGGLL